MNPVYIGLGSNLADPEQQLATAIKCLDSLPNTHLVCHSSLYSSLPMGPTDQPNYVNAVALINSQLSPVEMLAKTQAIELQQGRVRKANRWGPRTLDLDILLYANLSMHTDSLTIPHYGMKEREFVLYPLFEIAPELILPCGEKLAELVKRCPLNGLQKLKPGMQS
ncbi:2-amino-4-hydroxy-6-hydroxymethyldihydropteridine diphosphokinase [Paraglaciecola aestuariivivens]